MTEAIVETRGSGEPYQTVIKFGASGPRIHIFWRGDDDPDCHDHPADFWAFPLTSYVEEVPHAWSRGHTTWRVVRAFRLHRRRADFAHRLLGSFEGWNEELLEGRLDFNGFRVPRIGSRPIVTLVWWGKKRREWGFHTENGWVPWRTYCGEPLSSDPQPLGSAREATEGKQHKTNPEPGEPS